MYSILNAMLNIGITTNANEIQRTNNIMTSQLCFEALTSHRTMLVNDELNPESGLAGGGVARLTSPSPKDSASNPTFTVPS